MSGQTTMIEVLYFKFLLYPISISISIWCLLLTTPPFFLTLVFNPRHHDLNHCMISLHRAIDQPLASSSSRKSRVASQHTSALPRQSSINYSCHGPIIAGSIDFLENSTDLVPIPYFVGCQRNSPPCHIGVEERVLKRRCPGAQSTITVHLR